MDLLDDGTIDTGMCSVILGMHDVSMPARGVQNHDFSLAAKSNISTPI
jgi:hypothetical protein